MMITLGDELFIQLHVRGKKLKERNLNLLMHFRHKIMVSIIMFIWLELAKKKIFYCESENMVLQTFSINIQ